MLAKLMARLEHGRGRDAIVIRTAVISMLARGLSIVSLLITVPIVLNHVGAQRYGLWVAAIALSNLFTLADGGVTNGLLSHVSYAHGAGDRLRIRVLVGSGLAAAVAFVLMFLAAVLIAVQLLDWTWAFNLPDPALGREAALIVSTLCVCYALGFPAAVVRQTRLGLLQGAAINTWDLCGSILSVVALIAAVHLKCGLVTIATVWAGVPLLVQNLSAILFLLGPGRDLAPSWRDISLSTCRTLLTSGSVFMIYTLTQGLAVQSDQILVAHFLGVAAVTNYSIVQRLFIQPQVLMMLFLGAQWPAYGAALGCGDYDWIRRHFLLTLAGFAAFAVVLCGLLGLFCQDILRVWVGGAIIAAPRLVVAMAVYGIVAPIAFVFLYFFLALRLNQRLIGMQIAMLAVNLPLTIFLLPRIGTPGAIIGTTVSYLVAFVIPSLLMIRHVLSNLSDRRK